MMGYLLVQKNAFFDKSSILYRYFLNRSDALVIVPLQHPHHLYLSNTLTTYISPYPSV